MTLAEQITHQLALGVSSDEIVYSLGVTPSYVRAVRSRNGFEVRPRAAANDSPLLPPPDRVQRLLASGFSPWEVKQAIPSWNGVV